MKEVKKDAVAKAEAAKKWEEEKMKLGKDKQLAEQKLVRFQNAKASEVSVRASERERSRRPATAGTGGVGCR